MHIDTLRFGTGSSGDHDQLATLARGAGCYTSDIEAPGQLHACFVRSNLAHAHIRGIDSERASASPGVHAVITGAQMQADGIGVIAPLAIFNGRDGQPMFAAGIPPLAYATVRHVGEAVALVIAASPQIAQDAAELVVLDLEALPVAASMDAALATGAVRIWPQLPDNIALDWEDGDPAASDAAFAGAYHVESVALDDPPLTACSMEPRSALALWDASTGRYTLIASTQGVMVVRKLLAEGVLKVAAEKLRVITPDVGGGFGAKVQAYPEYAAILYAARLTGRPVAWSATRLECFLGDTQGRHEHLEAALAFDRDGCILAVKADVRVGIGAYTSTYVGIVATNNMKNCLSSVYRIPSIRMRSRLVFTNSAPLGPYRGAGRPEAIYLLERLLDRASGKFGIDRAEIRRRNLIAAAAMPYSAPNGQVYDSGEFEAVLDRALALADWQGFAARRAQSARRGMLRGIGIGCFLEVAGGILEEPARLQFSSDGTVSLHTGAQALGQGHQSTFTRMVADHLGLDAAKVRLVQGDSDKAPGIVATVASRSMMMAGSATALACDEAIRRGKLIAAHLLEASSDDIVFAAGSFTIVGTDRGIPILELTRRLDSAGALPADMPVELSNVAKFTSPSMSYPNGCHVCEVEIDPETGAIGIVQQALAQHLSQALDHAANDLAIDDCRVEDHPDIIHRGIGHDVDGASVGIDFHLAHMAAVGIAHRRRSELRQVAHLHRQVRW